MSTFEFQNEYCSAKVHYNNAKDVTLDGEVFGAIQDDDMFYTAASPPDFRASYSGSALPFPSPEYAFAESSNSGVTKVHYGKFSIHLSMPNSYYSGLGTVIVPPMLYLSFVQNGNPREISIKLDNSVPFRTLTYPNQRTNAMFYDNVYGLPVRSQEQVLRDSGYPSKNITYDNFWGLKPAL